MNKAKFRNLSLWESELAREQPPFLSDQVLIACESGFQDVELSTAEVGPGPLRPVQVEIFRKQHLFGVAMSIWEERRKSKTNN